jgi:hypothetical protein
MIAGAAITRRNSHSSAFWKWNNGRDGRGQTG